MANPERMGQLERALRNADAAGDTAAATILANEIRQQRTTQNPEGQNWWESAPLVEDKQSAGSGKNWWDDAPLVDQGDSTVSPQDGWSLDQKKAFALASARRRRAQHESEVQEPNQEWARQQADKIEAARQPGTFSDATDSILQGIPFGDEIVSGAMAPLRAGISAIQGEGFDVGREYNRSMDLEAEMRRRREERSPVASTVGSVAGGLGVGGVAAKSGLSLLNKAPPTLWSMGGRGMAEGALWGAAYGAGEGSLC